MTQILNATITAPGTFFQAGKRPQLPGAVGEVFVDTNFIQGRFRWVFRKPIEIAVTAN